MFTLLKTRKPEFGTPQLALSLRFWSIVLHVLAGALIVGAAISEIWVSLDAAGPTLFGIYGAAAAVAILGALGFYLAYAAELPPPPPKPLRPKGQTRRRGAGARRRSRPTRPSRPSADADDVESTKRDAADTEADQDATDDDVRRAGHRSRSPTEQSEPAELTETGADRRGQHQRDR